MVEETSRFDVQGLSPEFEGGSCEAWGLGFRV